MERLSRREMLVRLGSVLGAATVLPLSGAVRARAQAAVAQSFISFSTPEGETLRAIVARLIPSDENGPGALEARVDRYIDRALAGALRASRAAYTAGLAELNGQAQSSKGTAFAKLSPVDQDAALRNLEQTNAAFFNLIRTHTIQGMFSDPFYGGNDKFIGWNLIAYPGARISVSADMQRLNRAPEPSGKSAYDYAMFSKGEV